MSILQARVAAFAGMLFGIFFVQVGFVAAEDPPVLDPYQFVCSVDDKGVPVRMQCDDVALRCLVAPAMIMRDGKATDLQPKRLSGCSSREDDLYVRKKAENFLMVPAVNDAPYGYNRDERNRLFQTSFDLRNRFYVGLHDAMSFDPFDQSFGIDHGISYEHYKTYKRRRQRFKFLEGELAIAPLFARGTVATYDLGTSSKRANLWLTTFIGKPRRFDINLDLGPGIKLGRYRVERINDDTHFFIDPVSLNLNWEMFHKDRLEDYVLVRLGGGVGIRGSGDQSVMYLYPEVGFETAWRAGDRGLTELRLDAYARFGFEPEASRRWFEAQASASLERVVLAISDQPITLFLKPSVRYIDLAASSEGFEARAMIGGRFNFFVSVPKKPERKEEKQINDAYNDDDSDGILNDFDNCPEDPEDFDGFQDADGCPELDNDGDGIADANDHCPMQPEDFDGDKDDDGCPESVTPPPNNDADGDGIADSSDACPENPEDKDGFQDGDGCPEPDNDQDGYPDTTDKCPNQAAPNDPNRDGCPG